MKIENLTVHFAENLKRLREKKSLTQPEMAESLGLKHTVIHQYEKSVSFPRISTLVKLVEVYDVNIHEMIFTKGYGDPELESLSIAAESAGEYAQDVKDLRNTFMQRLQSLQKQIDEIKHHLKLPSSESA